MVDGDPSGIVQFATEPAGDGRVRLTVTHEKLGSPDAGEHWRSFWGEWLATLDEVTAED